MIKKPVVEPKAKKTRRKETSIDRSMNWMQWTVATSGACIAAAFLLITYMHSTFVSSQTFTNHQGVPHKDALKESRYLEDFRSLKSELRHNREILEKILQEISRR